MKIKFAPLILALALAALFLTSTPARPAPVNAAADYVISVADGTEARPALAFESSKGTGLFYAGSHSFSLTSNKAAKATVGSTGLVMSAGAKLTLDAGTAAATAGAATLSKQTGTITTEALTTAPAAAYTLTLTNTQVTTASKVFVSVDNGTNTQGIPVVGLVTPGSGSVVIKVYNLHASQALNGTLKISFLVAP
jgi:hypothetical protein